MTELLSAVGTFSLAAAFVVAYFGYHASLKNSKIEKTFEIINQWEDKGYMKDANDFGIFVQTLETEALEKLRKLDVSHNDQLLLNYTQKAIFSNYIIKKDQRIENLLYFFNKISYCASSNICDRNLIREYFGQTMISFRAQTDLIIQDRRKVIRGFSSELDLFLK